MRCTRLLFGVVGVVTACCVLPMGGVPLAEAIEPPPGYDLLGPARRGGDLLRHETEMRIANAPLSLSAGGKVIRGKIDIKGSENEDVLVMAARGHQLRKYKRKVNMNRTVTYTTINGQRSREVEHGVLEGRTVLAILRGRGWHHSLVGARANKKQRKAMLELSPPEPDTPYYPSGNVRPGHSWKVNAKGLAGMFSSQFSAIRGKARMTFVKTHLVRRRLCARIRVSLRMRARMSAGNGNAVKIRIRMTGYIDRAIKIGLDLRMRLRGRIYMSGTMNQGNQQIGMSIHGPFSFKARNVLRRKAP